MNEFVAVSDLRAVFDKKRVLPTIVLWNRLEGRPRTHDFDRALKAEIRDPLWMLCKQWQMGEFRGDDAGSPVTAKIHAETTELTKYKAANDPVEAFPDDVPLEARVERRPVRFSRAGGPIAFDLRVALGKRWLRLIAGIEAGLEQQFRDALSIAEPDPDSPDDAAIAAHLAAWQHVAALAGRALDGGALIEHLAVPGNRAVDLVTLADATNEAAVDAAEAAFLADYARNFYQPPPDAGTAWLPERMEYAFEVSAPKGGTEKHLVADGYHHGHLDWYNLDIDPRGQGIGDVPDAPLPEDVERTHTFGFLPGPIQFDGMPHTRWWRFEDGRTNFGDIDPDTTDINKLLLMEFGLVYANDWFLLPITLPAGTISNIAGVSVTNVFGERTWIEAAGRGNDEDWQRWAMYGLATAGDANVPADQSLLLLPSVSKIQEGPAREAVQLTRDEMANMVWGIETKVPMADGSARRGIIAARETRRYHKRIIEAAIPDEPPALPLENEANIRYRAMTRVPENWIPFVPVHIEGSTREVQLRRSALLRVIEDDPNPALPVRPRTDLLRHNLDLPVPEGYDVFEEEVPRAGAKVTESFQRCRWYGGEVFLWIGRRKTTGRGERSSNLAFDRIRRKSRR
ncbi:hypothetical protein RA28_14815 [Ruegeria sp. ANG-S4]|uniref:hypothetical protein n=1 Tax=Ruegeria sp. ANG-S4 TaxID=1577904 RepID=UPI00057D84C5|nr:hypothetical protein [Ruegeria sp. ANG-S4]KIC44233.1 hypothetical protein RA28_14815 [Ruegeria sp. ANG-S4]